MLENLKNYKGRLCTCEGMIGLLIPVYCEKRYTNKYDLILIQIILTVSS